MANAARAIILHDNKLLLMRRNKQGSDYYTLVGGKANHDETIEQALIREVKEETGLTITDHQLVFTEKHPAPYNDQYIFLCQANSYESAAIAIDSEEALLNRIGINIHALTWVDKKQFDKLPFFTMPLQQAISTALKNNFPHKPLAL